MSGELDDGIKDIHVHNYTAWTSETRNANTCFVDAQEVIWFLEIKQPAMNELGLRGGRFDHRLARDWGRHGFPYDGSKSIILPLLFPENYLQLVDLSLGARIKAS
ncbi:hypothetical protein DWF00_28565 [Bosea caraganae]|uniref:Uncharacterized protein n=1 Tax=Bosea caraganae TaxID=2763117 RepID=A0A370L2S9_9HYPH|nr:hypothetical protein DWF00_28565 [Bosea caraganae]RDJ22573.1 hypothetical protein DWE98_19260 [Bosea caraganae]